MSDARERYRQRAVNALKAEAEGLRSARIGVDAEELIALLDALAEAEAQRDALRQYLRAVLDSLKQRKFGRDGDKMRRQFQLANVEAALALLSEQPDK